MKNLLCAYLERSFDSSEITAEGTMLSASAEPYHGDREKGDDRKASSRTDVS